MFVNGIDVGSVTSQGGMEQLSVGNDIFIGGYDQDELPVGIKVSGHHSYLCSVDILLFLSNYNIHESLCGLFFGSRPFNWLILVGSIN